MASFVFTSRVCVHVSSRQNVDTRKVSPIGLKMCGQILSLQDRFKTNVQDGVTKHHRGVVEVKMNVEFEDGRWSYSAGQHLF